MKRKVSSSESRIWTYGCLDPGKDTMDQIYTILKDGNIYYNNLVEMEREKRRVLKGLRTTENTTPEVKALYESEDTKLRVAINEACRTKGYAPNSVGVYPPRAVAMVRPDVVAQVLDDPTFDPGWKERLKVFESFSLRKKELRANTECPCSTYVLIEKAFEQACLTPKFISKPKGFFKDRPFFKPFDGTGRVGVIIDRVPFGSVLNAQCNKFEIRNRSHSYGLGGLPRQDRLEVKLQVGPGKASIVLPCVISRMPPSDSIITQVWLKVDKVGPTVRLYLQMVIESTQFSHAKIDYDLPTVAVDIGWRVRDNGDIRYGYWMDSMGNHGELLIPSKVSSDLKFCDSLTSYRQKHFNHAIKLTRFWLKRNRTSLPVDVINYASHIHSWKSPRKLARMVYMLIKTQHELSKDLQGIWNDWKEYRHRHSMDLFDKYTVIKRWAISNNHTNIDPFIIYLDFWYRKNKHLYIWDSNQRDKTLAFRDYQFRCVASAFDRKYGRIIFENFDLRGFARNAVEDEDKTSDRTHWVRNIASPGRFRDLMKSKVGDKLQERDMGGTTVICHKCEHVNSPSRNLNVTCSSCGATWDQDYNACFWLLKKSDDVSVLKKKMPSRPKTGYNVRSNTSV